jgi:hypothetical protein
MDNKTRDVLIEGFMRVISFIIKCILAVTIYKLIIL